MGEENEEEREHTSLFSLPFLQITGAPPSSSPEHPSTPPLQTLVSIPFKWEEEPGKPRPDCTTPPEPAKFLELELPPCRNRMFMEPKTPSPTTVLDGPYNVGRPKFSSFRFFRDGGHDSFDSFGSYSPEISAAVDELFGSSRRLGGPGLGQKLGRGFFGKFKGGKRVVDGGSCRFSPSSTSSCDIGDEIRCRGSSASTGGGGDHIKRNGSFSIASQPKPSHFLVSIYQGLKQAMQWKSGKKSSKGGGQE